MPVLHGEVLFDESHLCKKIKRSSVRSTAISADLACLSEYWLTSPMKSVANLDLAVLSACFPVLSLKSE
jgi:hypothetical protein